MVQDIYMFIHVLSCGLVVGFFVFLGRRLPCVTVTLNRHDITC